MEKKEKNDMHQTGYIREILNRFAMTDSKPVFTPMDLELVGTLMSVTAATRIDIAFAVSSFRQFNTNYC